MYKLLLFSICIQLSLSFLSDTKIQTNIFTIQTDNLLIEDINLFTEYDIELHNLDVDKSINIYSLFTKNYFSRCHQYNDPNCEYAFEDQEYACKQILDLNNTYTMYYYGIYNNINIPYVNYLIEYNDIFPIQPVKYNINYQILGVYLLENSNMEFSNYKINIHTHEPNDFYKQMMLYLIPENNKTIFCPYWIHRDEFD